MTSLQLRVLTAAIVILAFVALTYFFQVSGIRFAVIIFVLAAIREAGRIFFFQEHERNEKFLLMFSALMVFLFAIFFSTKVEVIFSLVSIFSISILLLKNRNSEKINDTLTSLLKMFAGIFYIGLLPTFAYLLLNLKHNLIWFSVLLLVVFAGDTMAYTSGLLWGKEKIASALSPKKTVVGAIGGLVGSFLAGLLSVYLLPHIPWYALILMSLVAGFVGQVGDFFESLLKRVAGIKDSGTMMPGHGGILDRIDGVLFASPVVYFVAALFQ